jgi:hypothetical protein
MPNRKKIFVGLAVVFIFMQFFTIDKTNPPVEAGVDMVNVEQVPTDVAGILKTSCYDCHTYESVYPWYTNVAPVSWWIKKHIDEGRDELNFSEWGSYSLRRKDHKLDEIVEMIDEEEMPLPSYLIAHGDASLSTEQKAQLVDWAKAVREELGYVPEEKE